jgi:hypothetical protein
MAPKNHRKSLPKFKRRIWDLLDPPAKKMKNLVALDKSSR